MKTITPFFYRAIAYAGLLFGAGLSLNAGAEKMLAMPESLSPETQVALSIIYKPSPVRAAPSNVKEWIALQERIDTTFTQMFAGPMKAIYQPTLLENTIAGIEVLEVSPKGWTENGKRLIYLHGGAYTRFSPMSTLATSVPIANDVGVKVIAVDYTLAPHAQYKEIGDEIISVYKALLASGIKAKDIAFIGDSAGGGLVTSVNLRLQEAQLPMPAALVLWSPWVDINSKDDTTLTLMYADPVIDAQDLRPSALAYAPESDWQHPWVSPLYGQFNADFPPTLIQCGTREFLLSQCVRLYQKLDDGKREAKLDIYEGMPHVFQAFFFQTAEAQQARKKVAEFLQRHW